MVLRSILGLLLIWPLAGFPLVAVTSYIFGLDNSTISLLVRASVAVGAVITILFIKSVRLDFNMLIFLVFSALYALQLVLTFHLRNEMANMEPILYWSWAFGGCLIPAIALYAGFESVGHQKLFKLLLVSTVLATGLMLIFGSTFRFEAGDVGADIGRWNIPSFNPIAMGHLGSSSVLLGIAVLLGQSQSRGWWKLLGGGAILVGGYLLILANSRGPLIALGAALFLLLVARLNQRGTNFLMAVLCGGVAYLFYTSPEIFTEGLMVRFAAITSGGDTASELRLLAFSGAWEQFLGSPLIGDGIEERITGYYPHNVVLEAFMATGILGGLAFVFLLFRSLLASWHILRRSPDLIWLALLAVQYMIAAQFSGSIYQSTAMWACMAAVLGAFIPNLKRPNNNHLSRYSHI